MSWSSVAHRNPQLGKYAVCHPPIGAVKNSIMTSVLEDWTTSQAATCCEGDIRYGNGGVAAIERARVCNDEDEVSFPAFYFLMRFELLISSIVAQSQRRATFKFPQDLLVTRTPLSMDSTQLGNARVRSDLPAGDRRGQVLAA
jgi:hypothetical protein